LLQQNCICCCCWQLQQRPDHGTAWSFRWKAELQRRPRLQQWQYRRSDCCFVHLGWLPRLPCNLVRTSQQSCAAAAAAAEVRLRVYVCACDVL
jgi:hypothetical protein